VVPLLGGTTTVVFCGGGGLELLMHPLNSPAVINPAAIVALNRYFIICLLCFATTIRIATAY
jgi:hypothetical protein